MYKKIGGMSIVLLIMLLVYCCYPCPLRDITDIDSVESLYGSVVVMDINDGTTIQQTYEIQTCDSTSNEFKEIMKILQSSSYQQDLSNLIPISKDAFSTTDVHQLATITLCSHHETCTLYLLDNNSVYLKTDNYKAYHMTSNQTLLKLIEYIKNSCL